MRTTSGPVARSIASSVSSTAQAATAQRFERGKPMAISTSSRAAPGTFQPRGRISDTESAAPGLRVDLEQRVRVLVLDLQRGVVDGEALVEQPLELVADAVAVVAGRDQDMGRERREPRGHLPDVEVVDLDDPGVAGQRAADRIRVEVAGRALEQHQAALAQQAPGRP